MDPKCLDCLSRVAKRHGPGFVIAAVRQAAERQLREIEFSLASEERIAEQAEPWRVSCDELSAL